MVIKAKRGGVAFATPPFCKTIGRCLRSISAGYEDQHQGNYHQDCTYGD
jgi:hypothetical protein